MITHSQIRMAKAALDWSFEVLATKTGLSVQGLMNLANGKSKPQKSTHEKLVSVFEENGIELIEGGARFKQDIVQVYEGEDCYLRVLDDAAYTLKAGEEFLASGCDERRSSDQVVEKLRAMRKSGIKMRSLIRNQDTYIMGGIEEYRWMPDVLFAEGDVKVIFGNTVAYLVSWLNTPRVIKIKDKNIAEENLRIFNYIWDNSTPPSTHNMR